jgi:hypothetical protein
MAGSFHTLEVGAVRIVWGTDLAWLSHHWPDGVTLHAAPDATSEYTAEAERRGCGDDLGYECIQHELAHQLAMVCLGYPCSPTLRWWAATHGQRRWGRADAEEKLVFDLQRLANRVTDRMPHGDYGLSLRGPLSPGEWERVGAMARLG